MKSIKSPKSGLALCAILLTTTSFSQIQESPIKGQWGLSTGVAWDQYKVGVMYSRMRIGILPMLTYTSGKNQFELGYQFQPKRLGSTVNQFHGITFNYKRYFNGFGDRFVPYLYTGISFTTTRFYEFYSASDYRQTGVNMSIGYGLEWQMGKGFYMGSSVGLNPGIYSVRGSRFPFPGEEGIQRVNRIDYKLGFNVNMQIGYRFGGKKK